MCRVCHKRPEIPDERYGRCEPCAKGGRIAFKFRVATDRQGVVTTVKSGELSPHALHQKWTKQLADYKNTPKAMAHLGLHEAEMVVAKERLETIRIAQNLVGHESEVLDALRNAATRSDTAW
jgi:hypothetical protein